MSGSRLVEHANRELTLLGYSADPEHKDIDFSMYKNLIDIVELFASQGHSGSSAAYAIGIISKLLDFKPLSPLTYRADEWEDMSDISKSPLWQNIRDSRVFSIDQGKTHYSIEDES